MNKVFKEIFRSYLLIVLILNNGGAALGFTEATFKIDNEVFRSRQVNDYNIGNYDRKLSKQELLEKIANKQYERTLFYNIEANRYFYFAYVIDNNTNQELEVYLKWGGRFIDSMAYRFTGNELIDFNRFPSDNDIFYGKVPPGRTILVCYRLGDGNLSGHVGSATIQDFETLYRIEVNSESMNAILLGIAGIMILYNLGLFVFFRNSLFLYYSLYTCSALIALSHFNGDLEWSLPGLGFWSISATTFLLIFCGLSLSINRSTKPKSWLALTIMMTFNFVALAWTLITKRWELIFFSVPCCLLLCTIMSLNRAWERYSPAYYLLAGWGLFFLGITLNLVPLIFGSFPFLSYGTTFGFALEVCFFSFALGERVRLSEKIATQQNNHAFEQLKKVFYPHQITQIKGGQSLELTMPTGHSHACVVCFDIINSSGIKAAHKELFLSEALKECIKIMDEGYDPSNLQARAYRIKEMGDGFLCSVGFPFADPTQLNIADSAVQLAEDFVMVFDRYLSEKGKSGEIFCSIGVAMGEIEGRYPTTGVVEYDVYGPAVVAATRYECVRRDLFADIESHHIITIQNRLFQDLSEQYKKDYKQIDLTSFKYKVRGDPHATILFLGTRKPKQSSNFRHIAS